MAGYSRREFIRDFLVGSAGVSLAGFAGAQQTSKKVPIVIPISEKAMKLKDSTYREICKKMVDTALTRLTGMDTPAKAWKIFIPAGGTVGLKINNESTTTDQDLVMAITDSMIAVGQPAEKIIIFERSDFDVTQGGFQINNSEKGVQCDGVARAEWHGSSAEHERFHPNHLLAQDPPIDMYTNSWKNSLPEVSHGTMVERAILMPGDVNHPSRPGAVLTFAKKFTRGFLESHVQTTPAKHTGEEEILYIMKGKGRIEAGLKKAELIEGTGVLIPQDIEHTIINESSEPLEMLVLVDDFPVSKVPPKEIVVKNYHSLPVNAGGHWSHIVRSLFSQGDGMGGFYAILLVSVDGMNIPEPHPHGTGDEEGWYAIKGRSLLFLGKEIRWQDEGTAFIIPRNGKTPHSNINPGNDPVMFFYFRTFKKLEK